MPAGHRYGYGHRGPVAGVRRDGHGYMYCTCHHTFMLMCREYPCTEKKEERSKQGQTNNKAKQHSAPKAVTFQKKNKLPQVGLKPPTLHTLDRALYYMYMYISCYINAHTCIQNYTYLAKFVAKGDPFLLNKNLYLQNVRVHVRDCSTQTMCLYHAYSSNCMSKTNYMYTCTCSYQQLQQLRNLTVYTQSTIDVYYVYTCVYT